MSDPCPYGGKSKFDRRVAQDKLNCGLRILSYHETDGRIGCVRPGDIYDLGYSQRRIRYVQSRIF